MAKRSAGLLMYRQGAAGLEVLLVHPGGPFWAKKDAGAWSIPKGEYEAGEAALDSAVREFAEETGGAAVGPFVALGEVKQASGKVVTAWAFAGEFDVATLRSNTVRVAWPPRSGRQIEVPEVDRAEWFGVAAARGKLNQAQVAFVERLVAALEQNAEEIV